MRKRTRKRLTLSELEAEAKNILLLPHPCIKYLVINFLHLSLGLGTHLFVKVPRPGDSERSNLFGQVKLPPVTTSLTTHW